MTDQQMHERLQAAGARWRDVATVEPRGFADPEVRTRHGLARRTTWVVSAAAVLAAATALSLTLFAHLSGPGAPAAGSPTGLYGVRWTGSGGDTGYTGYKPAPQTFRLRRAPWLQFRKDGRVSGSDGCNSIGASFRVHGDSMTFGQLGSTYTLCPGPVGKVAAGIDHILRGSLRWRIACNTLMLTGHSGELDFDAPSRTAADTACLQRWSNRHAVK